MRKKLTPKLLDNLSPAEDKRYEIRDELVRGLLIRLSRTGGKVWYLATRIDGVLRRVKLGTYPVLSLKDAREKAQSLLRDIQLGTFQVRDVEPAPKVLTLGDVILQFITRYTQRHTKDWKGTERVLMRMNTLHGLKIDTSSAPMSFGRSNGCPCLISKNGARRRI
ncbi:Arm DNA-binding domain-containing protein [Ciceribacter sp. RN22]|uniref:Arm DNA-binding domain-containing protein n=1 Tax=Ciceribacter sp. RN22 TaxID=2954932 RepID=UPI0020920C5B|nr:Arm DNA-binding domain-containing protein [Ciceribacter sp. RN22]MCO6176598.1 Arm DNA-binding domain-containing protein [Ciceribacter sp. RN22]